MWTSWRVASGGRHPWVILVNGLAWGRGSTYAGECRSTATRLILGVTVGTRAIVAVFELTIIICPFAQLRLLG